MSITTPQHVKPFKYLEPIGIFASTLANGTITLVNDATADELAIHFESTGAAINCVFEMMFQIPADFKKFEGIATDLVLRAYQDGNSGDGVGDIALTVAVLDTSGATVDDSSIDDIALTGAYVSLDCPLVTGGTFAVGDYIVVQISVITKAAGVSENGDDALVTIPKIKYIPQ